MVNGNPFSITDLQRDVLHASASSPDKSASVIAEDLNCSSSYVREVQKEYQEVLEDIKGLNEVNYMPSFGHPYSILIPDFFENDYRITEGDLLELTFEVDGEEKTTYGEVEFLPEDPFEIGSKEHQARIHGGYLGGEELQEGSDPLIEDLPLLEDGRANLATSDEFYSFATKIGRILNDTLGEGIQLLIGIGIVEVVHGERDPQSLLSNPHFDTPYFDIEQKHFIKYIRNEGPELVNVQLYQQEVTNPNEVYFTYYGEYLDESQKQELRDSLLEIGYFKSTWNYSLPQYQAVVGPTTVESTAELIKVTEESLSLVPGIERAVTLFSGSNRELYTDFDGEKIVQAIHDANPQFEELATHSRYSSGSGTLPIRRNGESIYFLFDQVTLVLTAADDHLLWLSPEGIDHIETIVEAVNNMIEAQLELTDHEMQDPEKSNSQRMSNENWVFDTNTLYHDHVNDQPTSILHTIFPHHFFHESTIYIPWEVLFEMNKHPESGSATKAANDQGFENLEILRSLEHLGFLSIEVPDPPEEISSDLSNGDIVDVSILEFTNSRDARLVSGDQSLCDIARLSGVDATDVRQLSSLTPPISEGASFETDLLPRIGNDLHTRDEIIGEIRSDLNKGATVPKPDSSTQSLRNAESLLESWCSQEKILPYYRQSDESVCYAQRQEVILVPTEPVLEILPKYIDETNSYLTEEFLEEVSSGLSELDNSEFPTITLIVPSEYVVRNASAEDEPSEFNIGILDLATVETIEYHSRPAMAIQHTHSSRSTLAQYGGEPFGDEEAFVTSKDIFALSLSMDEENSYLLLPENRTGLWKFAKLLGVKTLTVSEPSETGD